MAEPSTAVRSAAAGAIGPFAGVRVLELTRGIAGRTAGMLLADLGADVVRASDDRPDTERDPGGLCWDRGKVLAPLHGTSTNELRRLAAAADVLVDNLRADSMTRLGLGDGVLAAGLPRLVRCSVSAYGRTGPFADLPGFDPVMQARSGMMLAQAGPTTRSRRSRLSTTSRRPLSRPSASSPPCSPGPGRDLASMSPRRSPQRRCSCSPES
jgi:crotonobetainyl-CoA:carnitine CoA-transferase CaiB-like acyl-CoA transferase